MTPERLAITVSELNEYARRLMAADPLLRSVEVTGEISGWKDHISGHKYFSLKDEKARVACVMWRQSALGLNFRPKDGMRVTVRAAASIFERDGSFQLYVSEIRQEGQGDLFARFEALKRKLMAEGLFDPARKREIPFFPRAIGVVTSETGAAIRDIVHVARRRNPAVQIILAPCAVQGEGAARQIVEAIRRLNASGLPEVLLVGRGGGSMEDLWCFNEEIVARAIVESAIPVISCVGHEIDFTISDFAADLRAPTPSAGAEMAVPSADELRERIKALSGRMFGALAQRQRLRRAKLDALAASPGLSVPGQMLIEPRRARLLRLDQAMTHAMQSVAGAARRRFGEAASALRTLDPAGVLGRGYAILEGETGLITGIDQISFGQNIGIRARNGRARATVTEVSHEEE